MQLVGEVIDGKRARSETWWAPKRREKKKKLVYEVKWVGNRM